MKIRSASFALPFPGALLASLLVHAGVMAVSPEQSPLHAPQVKMAADAASAPARRATLIKLRLLAAAPAAATTTAQERAPGVVRSAASAQIAVPANSVTPRAIPLQSRQPAPAPAPALAHSAQTGAVLREIGVAMAAASPPAHPVSPVAQSAAVEPVPQTTAPRFDATYLDNPAPAYPPLSRRVGEHGRVLLRVQVDAGGLPSHVEIGSSSGSPRLDQAALEAVRRWKFVPATRGDKAVSAQVLVPVQFSLKS